MYRNGDFPSGITFPAKAVVSPVLHAVTYKWRKVDMNNIPYPIWQDSESLEFDIPEKGIWYVVGVNEFGESSPGLFVYINIL